MASNAQPADVAAVAAAARAVGKRALAVQETLVAVACHIDADVRAFVRFMAPDEDARRARAAAVRAGRCRSCTAWHDAVELLDTARWADDGVGLDVERGPHDTAGATGAVDTEASTEQEAADAAAAAHTARLQHVAFSVCLAHVRVAAEACAVAADAALADATPNATLADATPGAALADAGLADATPDLDAASAQSRLADMDADVQHRCFNLEAAARWLQHSLGDALWTYAQRLQASRTEPSAACVPPFPVDASDAVALHAILAALPCGALTDTCVRGAAAVPVFAAALARNPHTWFKVLMESCSDPCTTIVQLGLTPYQLHPDGVAGCMLDAVFVQDDSCAVDCLLRLPRRFGVNINAGMTGTSCADPLALTAPLRAATGRLHWGAAHVLARHPDVSTCDVVWALSVSLQTAVEKFPLKFFIALLDCCAHRRVDVTRIPCAFGMMLLSAAAMQAYNTGYLEALRALLRLPPECLDLNFVDETGKTVFVYCCSWRAFLVQAFFDAPLAAARLSRETLASGFFHAMHTHNHAVLALLLQHPQFPVTARRLHAVTNDTTPLIAFGRSFDSRNAKDTPTLRQVLDSSDAADTDATHDWTRIFFDVRESRIRNNLLSPDGKCAFEHWVRDTLKLLPLDR